MLTGNGYGMMQVQVCTRRSVDLDESWPGLFENKLGKDATLPGLRARAVVLIGADGLVLGPL